MRFNDRRAQSEDRRPAVFGRAERLFEFGKAFADQESRQLGQKSGMENVFEVARHILRHSFDRLQEQVAREAVGHDDVADTEWDRLRFDVADKIDTVHFGQFLVRIDLQLVALGLLGAVVLTFFLCLASPMDRISSMIYLYASSS